MDYSQLINKIGEHDHVCLIYDNQEEQFGMLIPFFKDGLAKNEKCAYIADHSAADKVTKRLRGVQGNPFGESLDNDKFSVITNRESYLRNGYFEPKEMIAFWAESEKEALDSGFSAFRATGETTWIFGGEPGLEKFMEYEVMLTDFLAKHKVCAVCQYNRKQFSDSFLTQVFQTHPKVVYRGELIKNPLYLSMDEEEVIKEKMLDILNFR